MLRHATLVLFSFCVLANGQQPDSDKTVGMLNGRGWERLGSQKVVFIFGFFEGIAASTTMVSIVDDRTATKVSDTFLINKFTFGETAKELDKLYSDQTNILVPIAMMITHVRMMLKGESTKAELEQNLIQLRRIYNK